MPRDARRGWYWPLIVLGLLALGVGANVVLLVKANADPSFAVEPDYYRKALDWEKTQAQARVNGELGWEAAVDVAPKAGTPGRAVVRARLTDRLGAAVVGARVSLEAFHNSRSADRIEATLSDAGSGAYLADVPMRREGLWEFRVRAERGKDVFTAVLDQDVYGIAP